MKLRSSRVLQPNEIESPTPSLLSTSDQDSGDFHNSTVDVNDVDNSPISKCGECITCRKGFLKTDPITVNKLTGEVFNVTEELSCKSTGIIYIITCAHENCCMQYVGQTVNTLNKRCIGHRSGLNTGNEPKFVREHFNKFHKPSDIRITPICSVSLNSLDDNNNSNTKKSFTKALKKIEDEFILKFNTLYPYSLWP